MKDTVTVILPMGKKLYIPQGIKIEDTLCCFRRIQQRALSTKIKEDFEQCISIIELAKKYEAIDFMIKSYDRFIKFIFIFENEEICKAFESLIN